MLKSLNIWYIIAILNTIREEELLCQNKIILRKTNNQIMIVM